MLGRKSGRKGGREKGALHFIESIIMFGLISFLILTGSILLWASTLSMPDIQSFEQRKVTQSTKIYDRTGEVLLFDVHENIQRTVVPFENVSRHIKNATVAIEDEEFYEHMGVKPVAFLRAVLANLRTGHFSQGGSTITQQVIKNSVLTTEKKISRKLKEWVLAIKLEKTLTKEQILELYLNEAPYGGSMYGIEEASKAFFGKSALDVTLAEAAYLAALPQAPTFYSPYGNNKEQLDDRKNRVLDKMLEHAFITKEEYEEALREVVTFRPEGNTSIQAPHFVMFIRAYIAEKYGERALEERGLKVTTTLNYDLQIKAEEIVGKYALENEKNFNASNAALVAVDPNTGQILTMVGSRNYFDEDIDGNYNVALARRQPGSAFKPFVYATALKKGYTPDTVVFDVRTQFSTSCKPEETEKTEDSCYSPQNYDSVFRGPISMRNALAQSINVPAVKFLYLAGLRDSLQTAKSLGIDTLTDIGRYGLTLVLGGGEVSLLDMTSAYGVFAEEGTRNPYTGILKIEDNEGVVLEEFTPRGNRVLDKNVALTISDMLADNEARTPAFGSNSYLYFPGRDVAAKTGTTDDYRDAWIIGYTPNIAVGAWAGNNDNTPMEKKVAGFIVAPLWNAFMYTILTTVPDEKFEEPVLENNPDLKPVLRGVWEGGVSYYIDSISGKRATEYTPPELRLEKVVPEAHDILHWVMKDTPRGDVPTDPNADPQYKYWEYAVDLWRKEHGYGSGGQTVVIPTETDDVHKPEFRPTVVVLSFDESRIYGRDDIVSLSLSITPKKYPVEGVELFINDVLFQSKKGTSSEFSFTPASVQNIEQNNTLTIVVYDSVRNRTEVPLSFRVE